MVSLIVEASNGVCSIACFEEKNILAEKNFVCSNNLSSVILEEIEKCLKEANKKKTDLTEIISSEGPGSSEVNQLNRIRLMMTTAKKMQKAN